MSEREEPRRWLEVWEEPVGSWRWRYVLDGDEQHLELASNNPEPSYDDAVAAARLAYPDVPVQRRERAAGEVAAGQLTPQTRDRLLGYALTGGISLVLATLALRSRRWWLVLAAPIVASGVAARLRRSLP